MELFAESPKDIVINSLLMAVTGFFIGGPANLVSAAISADLGTRDFIFFVSWSLFFEGR